MALNKPESQILVHYLENGSNAFCRKSPPAKIRKGGGAPPLTISSFSLAAFNPKIRKANTKYYQV
jgi:hypothetical protein